jgi:predicted Zn-dependent protease
MKRRTAGRAAREEPLTYKEIPVVFHVLYDAQLTNVSDSDIAVSLNDVNDKFNEAKFRFVLVSINRKPLSDFSWYQEYMTEPATSNKIPSMYGPGAAKLFEIAQTMNVNPNTTLNIYVQPKLYNVLGFSFIPPFGATSINPAPKPPDGVWIRTATFSPHASSYNRNAVLIHEIGHYLGLFHTFNGAFSCQNFGLDCATTGDLVCDTPPFQKSNFNASCAPACDVEILPTDPWYGYTHDNHMDYMHDNCRRNFTDGQIARMHKYVVENRKSVYRTVSSACLADVDQDGIVTSQDFLLYLSCHGRSFTVGDCYKFDFNGDGLVGSADHLFFLSMIGETCTR